jgi:hypothetical protein
MMGIGSNMAHPVYTKIVQGETLYFEIRFVGEDLTDATLRIVTSPDIPKENFTVVAALPDIVKVTALNTTLFPKGVHDLRVWLTWPSGDVREEVGLASRLEVLARYGAPQVVVDTIDGGAANTIHTDEVDGGTA